MSAQSPIPHEPAEAASSFAFIRWLASLSLKPRLAATEIAQAVMGRALRHRNYRLFFCGQSISLIGTWLTRVATSWLVYRLTHSAILLGLVSFAGLIPIFLITPFAGVLVDRWNKHRVLLITQICAAIQSAALAVLTFSGRISIPQIIVLNVFQGLITAFDFPVRQALVVQMIENRADLPNAIALNSTMVNLARLIGPSFAGILIATVGEGGCFTIDAISYLAVIVSLLEHFPNQISGTEYPQ